MNLETIYININFPEFQKIFLGVLAHCFYVSLQYSGHEKHTLIQAELNLSYKITADRDFIFRTTEKNKLEYVNQVLSKFRLHQENLSKARALQAKEENDLIDKKLDVGPTTFSKKIFSIAGHLYIKANNPAMIFWKLRNLFKL